MNQEIYLPILPRHPLIQYLKPGIYSQFQFRILFSQIYDSEYFDTISPRQCIRVLNYVEWVAMRKQKMCMTCEGKWYSGHGCEKSCFVVFNPYNRNDECDEAEENEREELGTEMEEKSELDTCCSWEKANILHESSTDQIIEGEFKKIVEEEGSDFTNDEYFVDQMVEERLEQKVENTCQGELLLGLDQGSNDRSDLENENSIDGKGECDLEQDIEKNLSRNSAIKFRDKESDEGEGQELEENAEGKIQFDIHSCRDPAESSDELVVIVDRNSDQMLEEEPEKTVEGVSAFEGLKVFDEKPTREKELHPIRSVNSLGTDSTTQLKSLKVTSPIHVSLFDLVKSSETIYDFQDNLVGSEKELFKNLFGYYKLHKRKLVSGCVYLCERHLEYISRIKRVIRKYINCYGVKNEPRTKQRFLFDPGKKKKNLNIENWNINIVAYLSYFRGFVFTPRRTDYKTLVLKFKDDFEILNGSELAGIVALKAGKTYGVWVTLDEVFYHVRVVLMNDKIFFAVNGSKHVQKKVVVRIKNLFEAKKRDYEKKNVNIRTTNLARKVGMLREVVEERKIKERSNWFVSASYIWNSLLISFSS